MERTPEAPHEPAVDRGIQTRVAILVLVAALAPVVLLGSASFASLAAMRDALLREREALVASATQKVERGVREMLEALAAVPAGPDGSGRLRAAQRDALREAGLRSRLLSGALVIDAGGEILSESGIADPAASEAAARCAQVREAIRTGMPVVCSAGGDEHPRHVAVVPLRGTSGRTTAAAVGLIDTQAAAWTALTPRVALSGSAHLALLDADGGVMAGTPGRAGELVVERPLTILPWRVVLSQPESEVFAPVHALERRLAILTPALAAFAVVFAWGIARSVKRPLAQLENAAARIEAGDLLHPVPTLSRDEIGRLGRSFEAMRVALARDETRRKLLRKVISAQEDERKRLARELHDETCQTITALKMRLDPKAQPDAAAMADRSLDELHRIIYDLRPSILDDLGLVAAIRWMAQRHLAAQGIQVRCEFDDVPEHLPPEVEIAVFRAVQEAMSNVARHAQADKVLLEIASSDHVLEVDVEDDGEGFDTQSVGEPSASGRGLGILGMHERMELIGGTAHVASSPGGGTRVTLRVPIPEAA
ncbi:MAG TPA: ATP-binding protein [Candidatus Polarisedimenticolaceae bacterium]|nr:ATP-binding protein [Candidatus Polarisedimenticolaceae bacterium]